MAEPEKIRDDFVRTVRRPDSALDLARAALLVAAESDPRVDIDRQIHTLDSWAAELRARLAPDWNNLQKLARLRSFVFEELGFQGDDKNYFSPSNSLLHEVMERFRRHADEDIGRGLGADGIARECLDEVGDDLGNVDLSRERDRDRLRLDENGAERHR